MSESLARGPAMHGGELPLWVGDGAILDFSTTVNACGPPAAVVEALRSARVDVYPDRDSLLPRAAAAAQWGCDVGEVAFGAGTTELIFALTQAFIARHDIVVVAAPAFSEYARSARLSGATVAEVRVFPPGQPARIDRLCHAIESLRPRMVFVCDPNSPTGHLLSQSELARIRETCGRSEALLVLDSSLASFTDAQPCAPAPDDGVIHLRSITKDYALAGVRAGFLRARKNHVDMINAVRMPWLATAFAQSAAVAAMQPEATAHMRMSAATMRRSAIDLLRGLREIGIPVADTSTHFLMADVRDGRLAHEWLLRKARVHVRDCASFGEPTRVRIASRGPCENALLMQAMLDYRRDVLHAPITGGSK